MTDAERGETERGRGSLRAYMAYERHDGPWEGAVLVFARTSREARKLAAPEVQSWTFCGFTDVAARWLREDCAHLRQLDAPHVVEDPPVCADCERWHTSPLTADGLCQDCADNRGALPDLAPEPTTPTSAVPPSPEAP